MKKISLIKDVKDGGDVGAAARCFLVEKKRKGAAREPASRERDGRLQRDSGVGRFLKRKSRKNIICVGLGIL